MQQHESNISYGYFYQTDSRELGCHQLDVYVTAQPTRKHFDPVELRIPVRSTGGIKYLHVRHPWKGAQSVVFSIGRIILRDWQDKVVEAFSFGGNLSIEGSSRCTRFTFTSDAPIIALAPDTIGRLDTDFETRFVERAEGLIARSRAAFGDRIAAFEEQLTDLPPNGLYCATIAALEAELETHTGVNQEMMQFKRHLHEVHHHLAELHGWVDLSSLFATNE